MLHHPVIAEHDQGKQQFVKAAGLRRLPRQQRRGLRVQHHEVGLVPGLQVAHHTLQAERARILAYAQRIPGFRYTEVVSEPTPEWSGRRGYLTEHFEPSELRDAAADMYVCGPPPMVESIKSWLIAQNLQNVQLYYEKFTESNV